jgi:hypothetical protein
MLPSLMTFCASPCQEICCGSLRHVRCWTSTQDGDATSRCQWHSSSSRQSMAEISWTLNVAIFIVDLRRVVSYCMQPYQGFTPKRRAYARLRFRYNMRDVNCTSVKSNFRCMDRNPHPGGVQLRIKRNDILFGAGCHHAYVS